MATVNEEIVKYLGKLQSIYQTIDDKSLKREICKIQELISHVSGETSTADKTRKRENTYRENLLCLLDKKYELLKGTKVNFARVVTSRDVTEFIESHNEKEILSRTTALDLKLLYTVLTGEHREIKGTKGELLQIIKRNVRARKRGEAFSR